MSEQARARLRNARKSRMMALSGLLVILGAVEVALPEVRSELGRWAGLITMLFGMATAWLRWYTTTDLADK